MMSSDDIIVIDPAAEDLATAMLLAARLPSLAGRHIGLIDNSKHMASELLDEVEALLQSHYEAASFTRYRKSNPSVATPPEVLSSLTRSCDALVHGVAD